MTREDAIRRVGLLREVTERRGATANEAAVAASKAAALEKRFGLQAHEARPRSQGPRRETFTAGPFGAASVSDWAFDVATGKGSSNVKVNHYRDRANWSIEVPFP